MNILKHLDIFHKLIEHNQNIICSLGKMSKAAMLYLQYLILRDIYIYIRFANRGPIYRATFCLHE